MKEEQEEQGTKCDQALKPASSPIPAGYSSSAYIRCNDGKWEWYDPTIAE